MSSRPLCKYEKKYDSKINEVLDNTLLTNEQQSTLESCLKLLGNKDISNVFEDIYKLYINNYSTIEISKLYNRSPRTIQLIFKNVGLNRTRFDAQQIAAMKRNYVAIRKKFKNTMRKRFVNTQLLGSNVEQYIRVEMQGILTNLLSDCEIIIGINMVTKFGELDIPIVLFHNNKVYKYGVEVDGIFFHEDKNRQERDFNKSDKISTLGYKIFRLKTKAYYNSEDKLIYENEVKTNINNICSCIYDNIFTPFKL